MKKGWILFGIMICIFFTACAKTQTKAGSTTVNLEEGKKEETVWKEIQFYDVVFQLPEEYEEELLAKDVLRIAKSQNSSIILRYEWNQEKNRTKEYALGEYAATKMLEIAGKYPQAVFVESCIIDTEYGYYLKLSYEMMVEEKQVQYQVFYPMMESYDLVIECFDAKDYECTSYLETARMIAEKLKIREQSPKQEQEEEDKVTLATEIEIN